MSPENIVGFQLILILLLVLFSLACAANGCSVASCSEDDPPIRFPFWLKGHQPEHCGYPGFELSCSDGDGTMLSLPSSVQFFVREINYSSQSIIVGDHGYCLPRTLLNLNISESPFTFANSKSYGFTLLNCTEPIHGERVTSIPCLSSIIRHVLAVPATQAMTPSLASCKILKNFKSPDDLFESSQDNRGYLELNWDVPRCRDCEQKGGRCEPKSNHSLQLQCFDIPSYSTDRQKGKLQTKLIIGTSIGVTLLLIISVFAAIFFWKTTIAKAEENQKRIKKILEDCRDLNPVRYSFADIKNMTNELKHQLGQGGYGTVFKGELENGVPVAVKVLNNSEGNREDFTNEVIIMGRIHHVNIVRLLGFCADWPHRALVYEFMPNKSLDKFIFSVSSSRIPKLAWEKLQDIAIGVARGIEYLHQGCEQRILHFDIKPQNILLDGDLSPKISDFGLARLFPKKESVVSITAVRGTMGYIAPELYFSGNSGNVSYKSDVYSFGMLLFEMVGGRKNRDNTVENANQVYFPQWAYNRLAKRESLGIKEEKLGDSEIAKKLAVVALWCIQWNPADRPSMKMVTQMLEGRTGSLSLPLDPFPSLTSEGESKTSNMNALQTKQRMSNPIALN